MHEDALVQLAWITDVDRRCHYFRGGLFCRVRQVRFLMVYLSRLRGYSGGVIYVEQFCAREV